MAAWEQNERLVVRWQEELETNGARIWHHLVMQSVFDFLGSWVLLLLRGLVQGHSCEFLFKSLAHFDEETIYQLSLKWESFYLGLDHILNLTEAIRRALDSLTHWLGTGVSLFDLFFDLLEGLRVSMSKVILPYLSLSISLSLSQRSRCLRSRSLMS